MAEDFYTNKEEEKEQEVQEKEAKTNLLKNKTFWLIVVLVILVILTFIFTPSFPAKLG